MVGKYLNTSRLINVINFKEMAAKSSEPSTSILLKATNMTQHEKMKITFPLF